MSNAPCPHCGNAIEAAARARGRCGSCNKPVSMLKSSTAAPVDREAETLVGKGERLGPQITKLAAAAGAFDPDATLADARPSVDHAAETLAVDPGPAGAATGVASAPAVQPDATVQPDTPQAAPSGALRRYADGGFVTMTGDETTTTADPDAAFALPYSASDVQQRIGAYDILGELGRGGMGVVYKAYSLRLCRMVALKMMTAGRHASEAQLVRFQNEAMLAARLAHPNIVPVFDAGEHEGMFYFVMAFIEGRPLTDLCRSQDPADLRLGVSVLAKTARALDYAHRKGIVHRDIKPDNILIDGDGEPQITDFGIAKNVQRAVSLTKSGATLGTPAYMAPEQANNVLDRIGPAADVYSLGATMYHVITGRPPFSGPNALAIVLAVLEKQPDPPRAVAKKVSGRTLSVDLETICLKAMEKPANQRYASARAMAEDLENVLADKPISARPVGAGERLQKLVKRNRAAFVGLLVVFTTLMFMAVGFGGVLIFNINKTSDSIREVDQRAGLDQAATLERAIVVNMAQGRADVVRDLVTELRKDDSVTGIEVVRTDRTLAYTDAGTRDAVASRLKGASANTMAAERGLAASVKMVQEVAFGRIDQASPAQVPRFDYPDDAWAALLKGEETVVQMEQYQGEPHLTVLKPIPNGEACQVCHGEIGGDDDYGGGGLMGGGDDDAYDYDYGDTPAGARKNAIRAVLVVRRSQAAVEARIADNTRTTALVGGATAGGFLLLLFLFVRLFGIRLRPQRFGGGKAKKG